MQLDDLSASAIIQMAASSEVVVWSRGYRSFEADCTAGEQQNIILPIQVRAAPLRPAFLLRKIKRFYIDWSSHCFVFGFPPWKSDAVF